MQCHEELHLTALDCNAGMVGGRRSSPGAVRSTMDPPYLLATRSSASLVCESAITRATGTGIQYVPQLSGVRCSTAATQVSRQHSRQAPVRKHVRQSMWQVRRCATTGRTACTKLARSEAPTAAAACAWGPRQTWPVHEHLYRSSEQVALHVVPEPEHPTQRYHARA